MPLDGTLRPRLNIFGGGISGLSAALKAVAAGYEVHVYEASPEKIGLDGKKSGMGGKIESSYLPDGTVVNNGAEFIDSTQTSIRELCAELGVKLIPATDQSQEVFQLAGGGVISDNSFYAALKPLQEKVVRDKLMLKADPEGALARKLDSMTLTDYLNSLAQDTAEERTIFSRIWRAVKGFVSTSSLPDVVIAQTLARIYGSEGGQDPEKISALQYVNEAPDEVGKLLASDCAYRVQGGTATIIDALENDLRSKGVEFHMNSKAASIAKDLGGKFNVTLENGQQVAGDKVVFALPSHALGAVKGLENLGFSSGDIRLMQNVQYTHSAKFSIKTKQPANAKDDTCLFSGDGFQAWRSAPDVMTFLVGGEKLNQLKGAKLRDYCLARYAQSKGVKADNFFDTSQVIFRGPDMDKPCYASPSPGQALALQRFARNAERLAENGVGIVGTYLPQPVPGSASIGFMDCGVQSASRTMEIMADKDRALSQQQALAVPGAHVQRYLDQQAGRSQVVR